MGYDHGLRSRKECSEYKSFALSFCSFFLLRCSFPFQFQGLSILD